MAGTEGRAARVGGGDNPSEYEFENILNFRDVGKTINDFLGRKLVREGLLYRSARPDDATPKDRRRLVDSVGIATVMDLRTKTEHLNAARKRDADLATPALVAANAALAEPLHIPGLRYLEIKLTGPAFERFLLWQLSWLSLFKFLILLLLGYRMPAISILGREVMLPRGLLGLGLDTLDQSRTEVLAALSALLDHYPATTTNPLLPLLVHCTQGKDRTGIVVGLVLLALGVPVPAIAHDYALSDGALVAERAARLAEIRELGLTDDFGDTVPGFIEGVAAHLEERYGGVAGYLDAIGFGADSRARLRERFLY